MLKYLGKIKFIGDLSLEDADILAKYAKQSTNILELGVGGSTQIFSQCFPTSFTAVEINPEWIEITKNRILSLEHKIVPKFYLWSRLEETDNVFSTLLTNHNEPFYDLIFIDGWDWQRKIFAEKTWNYLKPGGSMIFHDTRHFYDFNNAVESVKQYFEEIKTIDVNAEASNGKTSNMTVIHKKVKEPYVNWNHTEGKPQWAYGDPNYTGELLSWQ